MLNSNDCRCRAEVLDSGHCSECGQRVVPSMEQLASDKRDRIEHLQGETQRALSDRDDSMVPDDWTDEDEREVANLVAGGGLPERDHNTVQKARIAMVDGYNDVAPDATHGDGLDSALDAALGVLRTRIIDRRIEARSAGQHAVVDALTDLLAELD